MGDYAAAAEFYDLLYASVKDYPAEAELLAGVVRDAMPHATRLLDVACGSGEPGQLTHRHVAMLIGETDQLKVSRISRTLIDGRISRLEFSYIIGRPDGIEHLVERHTLGLFTQDEMETAFENAGLTVKRLPEVLRTRGLYVGQRVRSA